MCNQVVDVPVPTTSILRSPYKSVAIRNASNDDFSAYKKFDDDDDDDDETTSGTTNESFSEDDDRAQKLKKDEGIVVFSEDDDKEDRARGKRTSASTIIGKMLKKISVEELWKKWNFVGDYQI